MTKFTPLTLKDHGSKKWVRRNNYSFAAHTAVVPLVSSELSSAALEFPIGFVLDGGQFTLVALLAFRSAENYFVGPNGRWLGGYIPVALRSHPFRLLRSMDQPGKMLLCVDEESDCVGENVNGEPLFDASGNPVEAVMEVLRFLETFELQRRMTDEAVGALNDSKLISPWAISVVAPDRPKESVDGVYRIDEKALNQLADDAFLKLRALRALPIAYVQLLTMQQIRRLGQLADTKDKLQLQATEHQRMLNEMFNLDDGTIPL